jgi:hypothetical protein
MTAPLPAVSGLTTRSGETAARPSPAVEKIGSFVEGVAGKLP